MKRVQKQNRRATIVVLWVWLCACGFSYLMRDPEEAWWVPVAFVTAVFLALGVLCALITWTNVAEDD